jgi:hypothetical protein
MTSERPKGLNALEQEQYELAIEEQAYPFEEKAITVHESNLGLISRGVYNKWIEKSLQRLAEFVPVRYAKQEETSSIIYSLETYIFEVNGMTKRAAAVTESQSEQADPGAVEEPGAIVETETNEPAQVEELESVEDGRSLPHSGDTLVAPEDGMRGEELNLEEAVQ